MSGGSFDYLCHKDVGAAVEGEAIHRMACALPEYEGGERAALEVATIIAMHADMQARWRRLYDVLHGVEWHCSGDYSAAQVIKVLAKYNTTAPSPDAQNRAATYQHAREALEGIAVLLRALSTAPGAEAAHAATVEAVGEVTGLLAQVGGDDE